MADETEETGTELETAIPPDPGAEKVMISSTALDLPEHRKHAMDACLRVGMFPTMMDHLHASGDDAVSISMKMVDEAKVYLGIFGHRYGYRPTRDNRDDISVTEMEYNRAVKRGIPRMIFIMDKDHPIKIDDVEIEAAARLKTFLERMKAENIVGFFKNPEELRTLIVQSLSKYRVEKAEEKAKRSDDETTKPVSHSLHYVSSIPTPPDEYIAHPYTLLQTHSLVGRQDELNLLTKWVADKSSGVYQANILSVVAIGGMGKSALTWKWFNEIAPQEMKPLDGRMWWTFYESDASFENFIIRALAYVSKRSIEDVRKIPAPEREFQLLSILDREPFLMVLDGLERILIAYARMDAAYLTDNDYDRATANFVANAYGLPKSAAQSFLGEHLVRRTADPRAGGFLKRLSKVKKARILVSTRLYPFDLQRMDALPLPGCDAVFLRGLSNDDALNLWRSFGVSGAHDQLVPIFNSFGNHALLIQALASEIANYRRAPGDFEKWKAANEAFDPAKYSHIKDAMGHVLEYALKGLNKKAQKVLQTIAGFRMPTGYDTLLAVSVGKGKPCLNAGQLDAALAALEDRGLVGWDKRANRYDLHPIVRGVIWGGLGSEARQGVYSNLHAHFEAVPMIEDYIKVNSFDDLSPAIELYNTLIGMERYDDALSVFRDRLSKATTYRLSAGRQLVEMMEMLFPDGLDELPRLSSSRAQSYTLDALATGYVFSGQPKRAISLQRKAYDIDSAAGDDKNRGITLENLSDTSRVTGSLRQSEADAKRALGIARAREDRFAEAVCMRYLGFALATRGENRKSWRILRQTQNLFIDQNEGQGEGLANSCLANAAIWLEQYAKALRFASRGLKLAQVHRLEWDLMFALRVQGESMLGLDNLETAGDRLYDALMRSRVANRVDEEIAVLTALAKLRRRQGDEKAAREFLDDVWEYAERGPYPLLHADALNVLAQIEIDAGNRDAAIEAATKAYQLAWCDGPPYAYHWGLIKAQKHLEDLGAPLPSMPPFDESQYEPMPEVEIDPDDEFHVGESS